MEKYSKLKNLSPNENTPNWNKIQLLDSFKHNNLPRWVELQLDDFVKNISRKDFPCYFATIADKKNAIRYCIIPSFSDTSSKIHALASINSYLEELKLLKDLNSPDVYLLTLIFFFPPVEGIKTIEEYGKISWEFLNSLHALDKDPWPTDIPKDKNNPLWAYVIAGTSLFVNISTPMHKDRKSRNLGRGMTYIINPREIFSSFGDGSTNKVRKKIHERIEKYDKISPYPKFVNYGEGEPGDELLQYLVPDNNEARIPFDFEFKNKESA